MLPVSRSPELSRTSSLSLLGAFSSHLSLFFLWFSSTDASSTLLSFVDGLKMGGNTKAAIIRIGLLEMSSFTLEFFPSASPHTFSHHSAGVADLITTAFGGRNRKCAEAFVTSGKTFDELEAELLNGQRLQGVITAEEIYGFLEGRGRLDGCAFPSFFPFFPFFSLTIPPSSRRPLVREGLQDLQARA
jgi:hypothetical protein